MLRWRCEGRGAGGLTNLLSVQAPLPARTNSASLVRVVRPLR